jgi:hypothetical protein
MPGFAELGSDVDPFILSPIWRAMIPTRTKAALEARQLSAVFLAHVIWETLARNVISVGILAKLHHPQLTSVGALVYLARFRNYSGPLLGRSGRASIFGLAGLGRE